MELNNADLDLQSNVDSEPTVNNPKNEISTLIYVDISDSGNATSLDSRRKANKDQNFSKNLLNYIAFALRILFLGKSFLIFQDLTTRKLAQLPVRAAK